MTTLTQPHGPTAVVARSRGLVSEGWLVTMVLTGYVVFWVLGLSNLIWIAVAAPMLIRMLVRQDTVIPKEFRWWLLFLALSFLSITQVGNATRGLVWVYRYLIYGASGIIGIYVYNLDRATFPARRLSRALVFYWVLLVVCGFLALVSPVLEFQTPMGALIPASLRSEPYVADLFTMRIAQVQDFLGYDARRPAAPLGYTNDWGAAIALVTPLVLSYLPTAKRWQRLTLVAMAFAAVVPIVLSLNRGLWLTLGLGMVYAAGREALRGQGRQLVTIVGALLVVVVLILATPMGDLIALRGEEGHSDNRRLNLYEDSLTEVAKSPIVGHGGPVYNEARPLGTPPAGTHGEIWLVLVANGVPATIAFLGFFVVVLLKSRRAPPGSFGFWTNVMVVIGLAQLGVYSMLPAQLPVIMAAIGMALREVDALPASWRSVLAATQPTAATL